MGESFRKFHGFVAMKIFSEIWGHCIFWWHQRAIHESFLRENHFSINLRMFSPMKFPTIRCYCFCLNATYLILHLNNLHSFSVQMHHYHSACMTLLSFPSSSSFASSSLSIFRPNYCSPSLLSASLSFSLELPPSFPPFTVPPSFAPLPNLQSLPPFSLLPFTLPPYPTIYPNIIFMSLLV